MIASALFLVRTAAEVATKSRRTRLRFHRQLVRNIRDALRAAGSPCRVDERWSRYLVEAAHSSAGERIASVFGVGSVSPVDGRVPAELETIVRTGHALYADRVRGRTFAVRARRAGDYPFRSRDIMVQLGAALDQYGDVDLDQPDVTVSVEVRDGEAFLFSERIPGMGGLPLGVQGKAVALISGGFDSPVAAWLMLKRGIALEYVFCNLGGEAYERSVVTVAKVLADGWSHGDRPLFHVVDFERPLAELKRTVQPRYWQLVLKRAMYRAAERIAGEVGASAIVTGESMGQVSSQTLANLRAIDDVATLPVLRPLLGMDKTEIIGRAERIGTGPLSAHLREHCALHHGKPVTEAKPHAVRDEESRMDLAVLDDAVAQRKVLDLQALTPEDLVRPYLFTSAVPDHAIVVDCRDSYHYDAWHYPGAIRRDVGDLAAGFRQLDKVGTYVLYCSFGVQSAYLAEVMQRAGYDAYSFKGGVRSLQRYSSRPAA